MTTFNDSDLKLNQSMAKPDYDKKMSWKQVVAQNGPKAGNLTPLYGDSGLRIVDGSVLGGSTAWGAR